MSTYKKDGVTCVTLQPGDAEIIQELKNEGFNISGLFRKAIREQHRQVNARNHLASRSGNTGNC